MADRAGERAGRRLGRHRAASPSPGGSCPTWRAARCTAFTKGTIAQAYVLAMETMQLDVLESDALMSKYAVTLWQRMKDYWGEHYECRPESRIWCLVRPRRPRCRGAGLTSVLVHTTLTHMPLPDAIQIPVREYVLKHVVPKTINPRPSDDMEWFIKKFSFLPNEALRAHLAQAWWQARFVGRLQEALSFSAKINQTFIKVQIVLYASIFEAVVDCILESKKSHPDVEGLFHGVKLKERATAFAKSTKLSYQGIELVPAEKCKFERPLQDSSFPVRLKAATEIGVVKHEHTALILSIYGNRNNIHIGRAAASNFEPDPNESSQAYKTMFDFLEHAASWWQRSHPTPEPATPASK